MQTEYGTILENWQNYGSYIPLVRDGSIRVYTKDLNKENLNDHFYSILNIMRDGIEHPFVQHMAININFADIAVHRTAKIATVTSVDDFFFGHALIVFDTISDRSIGLHECGCFKVCVFHFCFPL